MDTSDGKTKTLLGRKFKTVKNGLDEAEVLDFLGGLIDQNKSLAAKLEHLESLTRLAERTVIEAGKEGENIKKEIIEKANAQAATIISEGEQQAKARAEAIIAEAQRKAEEQSQNIIKSAEDKAESIKAQANEEANKIIAEAKQKAVLMERQAQDIIKDAEEKAARIISEATEKAEELAKARTERAESEARHIINEAREKAESEARRIINEAKEKAEHEALLIRQRSEQLLRKSKKIAETEIREKLKKVYQGLLSTLEGIDESTLIPSSEEKEEGKLSEHEESAAAVAEATMMSEELVSSPTSQTEKTAPEKEVPKSAISYEGIVELIIPPPLGLDRMLQLHKHLRNIPNAKVLNLGVAPDKSITIRVQLGSPTPLLDTLSELPEVEKALEAQQEGAETMGAARKPSDITPVKRILIYTKK